MAKIIIIDDEPAMVEVIVTLCREKGHQVFPFNSAAKAIEQLDSIQPQVVIADIKMETMTGFDVLRHVREHHRQPRGRGFSRTPAARLPPVVDQERDADGRCEPKEQPRKHALA